MRSLVRSIVIAGGILVLAGVQNASAQIIDSVDFTTSFPFTVGYATVPAGSYTIRPDEDNPGILYLTGAHESVLFQATSAQARNTPSKTEVVFKRYGNGLVLKDVWVEGSNIGSESVAAEAELHMAKHGDSQGEQRVAARRKSNTSNAR
jgi:hypothetical protein